MTQFEQPDQFIQGVQQNAGGNIYNMIHQNAVWTPPVMLPPRAASFVGREEEIAWLLAQFADEAGKTIGLCGPGGMGKTALAAEALTHLIGQEDWLTRFPGGIFYHSFYAAPSLTIAFEEIAHLYGEESGADPHRAALRALSRRRALLVFDGVEGLADSRALRQLGGRHIVLLLSRKQSDAPDLAYRREIESLSLEQGIALLQRLAGPRAADRSSVERLVQQVGGYPLALQLTGSYLSTRQEEIIVYLRWCEREGLTCLHHGTHQAESVPVLLERTYYALTEIEQQIFAVLGLLAPASFPFELVQDILQVPEQVMRQALGSLVNFGVLRRPDQHYEVSHPLVHTFAKERLSSRTRNIWRKRLLATLLARFEQSNPYDQTTLSLWSPHVHPLLSSTDLTTSQSLSAACLFNNVGYDADTQGKYEQAESLYVRALAIREQELGASHPDTATSLSNLAELYQSRGKYAEAEPLLVRALAIREQELGPQHPFTATSLNNLAGLYQSGGKYAEAEPLLVRALAICEQELGPQHPDTAGSLNNLASLYYHQGKYEQAEPLLVRALAIRKQELGPQHPSTATSLNNLAEFYQDQGKYEEAKPLYQQALAIYEQELGPQHPFTAASLNNLAGLHKRQGKYEEAKPLYQRALAIREQELGASHPDTATSLNNLAGLYQRQGKYAEAEPLLVRALAICEQELGPQHPNTQKTRSNYTSLLKQMERESTQQD